ncbi:MAG: TraR/DksA family transcriptional regulator [Planctomycetota bacterium]
MAKSIHDKKFLAEMRELLVEQRDMVRSNIEKSQSNLKASEGHHLADMEDLASDAADEATSFEILEIGSRELEQIRRAFQAMEDNTYGLCEECSEPVGKARLRALPFATMCIDCKREMERENY